jgi:hypothetical protein
MHPRGTSGQAGVEYIAVVALVAIVFAIGGSFVLNGRAIAAATVGQLKRGLCIVEGHDCAEKHPPCSVSSRGTSEGWNADIALVRVGAGKSALVEHLSDGRILVTLTDHTDLGVTGGFGATLKLGDKLALGGEIRAAALASLGHGTTYEVPDDRTADELIHTLRENRTHRSSWGDLARLAPRVKPPVSQYRQLDLSASASLKVFAGNAGAAASEDLVSGERTIYLKASGSLETGIGGSGDVQLAVTLDRHDKPVDLMVLGAGKLEASADLPGMLQSVAGHVRAGRNRTWQVEGHLDLTQPGMTDTVMHSLTDPRRLAALVRDEGTVQFNSYGGETESFDVGAHAKLGLSLGGEISRARSRARLLSAMEHTPEGFWVPRYDCLTAA